MKNETAKARHTTLPNLLKLSVIAALGLLCLSMLQTPLDPVLEKAYGLFAAGTTGLLVLHHSLLH